MAAAPAHGDPFPLPTPPRRFAEEPRGGRRHLDVAGPAPADRVGRGPEQIYLGPDENITPDDIVADEPLFVDGLGLDSIDALELGLALQKQYGITLDAEAEDTRAHFASLNALRELVEARRER